MFIPCIIRRIRNDQQYALICNTLYSMYWLLHVSAVACHHHGASSILLSYVKYVQCEWVVYHIMCGYVACVPDCCGVVRCASQLSAYAISNTRGCLFANLTGKTFFRNKLSLREATHATKAPHNNKEIKLAQQIITLLQTRIN
jgi:hypothetical protein